MQIAKILTAVMGFQEENYTTYYRNHVRPRIIYTKQFVHCLEHQVREETTRLCNLSKSILLTVISYFIRKKKKKTKTFFSSSIVLYRVDYVLLFLFSFTTKPL